jgi:4-diphosphocytidyl-2-C-methyl-D-erythritol kinase
MRWLRAPAKLNLNLRVIGRRADGYHELESLVAFAGVCDWLAFEPGADLVLEVAGPRALEAGPIDDNLVLRAARSLAAQIPGLPLGRFRLIKHIPAAAGLGGGSSDAAAALRLIASEIGLSIHDPRVRASARQTGSDVLACLCPRARIVTGVGDQVGPAILIPRIFAVLVNPRFGVPTPKVFAALGLAPGAILECSTPSRVALGHDPGTILNSLSLSRNDLEAAAQSVAPVVATVLAKLSRVPGAELTRMTGSGATCFSLFSDRRKAAVARRIISTEHPSWWVKATALR